mmetsp:Transcript_9055/g.20764  ORF Transcript_9055/g.20764 Transcript_9055/m.20764 type:complete len:109 (+) Transcript_9055:1232-1558(+)
MHDEHIEYSTMTVIVFILESRTDVEKEDKGKLTRPCKPGWAHVVVKSRSLKLPCLSPRASQQLLHMYIIISSPLHLIASSSRHRRLSLCHHSSAIPVPRTSAAQGKSW